MKMIICVGMSASGKSTFAKDLCHNDDSFVEINRDFVRFNIVCPGATWTTYKFTRKREQEVTEICNMMVMDAVEKGKNIIQSDTNLNVNTLNYWKQTAEDIGYTLEIKEFPIGFGEATKRDNLRPNGVGQDVIYKQYLKWLEYKGLEKHVHKANLPEAILCDLDGTLAFNNSGRGWYDWMAVGQDSVNEFLAETLNLHYSCGLDIIIVSGRDSICREETKNWLVDNQILFDALYMREEGDMRKDSIVKMEIYAQHIKDKYNVIACFDDRPQVLRDVWIPLGIQTYTVGNFMENF